MSGIDHLVLCVEDLDQARTRHQAMGFTMTPTARHPFGTGNSLVQLEGCFLEVLTVMAAQDIPEHQPGHFSFAAHNRDFLAEGEGFSMLVLESADARADQQRFASTGLKTYEPFDFSRKARLPSGEDVTVGFSLAFATDPLAPANAFFTCQQHAPEHFWNVDYQRHANTAHTVTDVCLVSPNPQAHASFLQSYAGAPAVTGQDGSVVVETGRGRISAVLPTGFENVYRTQAPDLSDGARLFGYRVGVDDLVAVTAQLTEYEMAFETAAGRIHLSPEQTFGVAVVFEQKPR